MGNSKLTAVVRPEPAYSNGGYTARRLWINPAIERDLFALADPGGAHVADIDYRTLLDVAAGKIDAGCLQQEG